MKDEAEKVHILMCSSVYIQVKRGPFEFSILGFLVLEVRNGKLILCFRTVRHSRQSDLKRFLK